MGTECALEIAGRKYLTRPLIKGALHQSSQISIVPGFLKCRV